MQCDESDLYLVSRQKIVIAGLFALSLSCNGVGCDITAVIVRFFTAAAASCEKAHCKN